jgi:DNA-binding response OmpR family regulator
MSNLDHHSHSRLQRLQDENDTLREQVAYLSEALVPYISLPKEWNLTRREERIVRAIAGAKDIASHSSLMAALYWDRAEPAGPAILPVLMCNLRKKLRPVGIEIKTLLGRGYYLPADAKAALRQRGESA